MKFGTTAAALLSILALCVDHTEGHGRVVKPPHRGYLGRLPKYSAFVPVNYDDDGLSAGGLGATRGGKHGVCGDPYNGAREHETGGKYGLFPKHGSKVIAACYAPGATVDIEVDITANHWGYFTFGLCKLDTRESKETEECFQLLAQPNGETKWPVPYGAPGSDATANLQYKLPASVTCEGESHCVLRWWYTSGNNPGGVNEQEQFWNCIDIYIGNSCGATPPSSPTAAPATTTSKVPVTYPPVTTTKSPATTVKPFPSSYAPITPATPTPSPFTRGPTVKPTVPPPAGTCGGCTNCYYGPTKACFSGWTKQDCSTNAIFTWCGA
ncbi:hypothetical protein DYB28_015565 [Aphanomyces astaci]|uniref:Chitin-binding type-4 domain-containing protein n=1 Tax=Aphanomyces astaci TaxID=112090 RepID=A0A397FB81_APHAT|nr:hypothetical protein DYB36_004554 [Aphanomyces astaci]RHY58629.1 hypothetical protein DYB34_011518 [Aphanomyces astaci]RHY63495.1 hypothetical protein DYB30_007214 [Aphanomyces astaci]RHY78835.1 hypothetical protein DYB38_009774 [Aphanomyces astaci]RHZ16379.1 hypothetical protein DYB31_006152 [Aphanomyces astaci]